jgi:myosin-crossreactive antigen
LIAFGYLECPRTVPPDDEESTAKIATLLRASTDMSAREQRGTFLKPLSKCNTKLYLKKIKKDYIESHG